MLAWISVSTPDGALRAPLPMTADGRPFVPGRGDQVRIDGREFIIEGIKWYFEGPVEDFQVVAFAHEIK